MSLNWREIDLVLEELNLEGSHIQEIRQPDYKNLFLFLYRPGGGQWLRICLDNRTVRLHATAYPPKKPKKPQRFAEFLKKRLSGGRILSVEHVNHDRLLRIDVERAGERTTLYLKLWGGSANLVATDEEDRILDAFYRKPKRGIASGELYELPPAQEPPPREVREWSGAGSFNEFLDEEYRAQERESETEALLTRLEKWWDRERAAYHRRQEAVQREREGYQQELDFGRYGDLIMANLHRLSGGEEWLEAEDFTRENEPISVRLDPAKSPQENAEEYYERAKKARRAVTALEDEIDRIRREFREKEEEYQSLEADPDARRIRELTAPGGGRDQEKGERRPGLRAESGGFTILVGRNARENDELLRRHVRGNDWWLHTRDFPGGYVFIKAQPGKSIPLEVLLDAGNLALFYSKGRGNGQAELYYTQVKHLRRAKGGSRGLVLPTQEKNLHVDLDEGRIRRLLS
ncbi:MAG: NFACT RNA binding domain-containing protein [Alkalispirochaetaceae bacterium]